jgi:RimJ/RimL family protein N-acetyltransferase
MSSATMTFTLARLKQGADQACWWGWYFIHRGAPEGARVVVGAGGFQGPPATDGTVEIGYSMLPVFQSRGYATEAADGLIAWGFQQPAVRRIIAETLPESHSSMRVLEKNGFTRTRTASRVGVIRFERWRADYLSQQ